jgi:RNA polymerase sigma-70 factor (ECF subfamily)
MDVFDPIYHETSSLVFYTILGILKDRSLAEDIMQEAYLNALEKIHTFRPTHSFQSWIVRIAKNLAINEYNRRKRELSFDPSEDPVVFGTQEASVEQELLVEEMLDALDETERQIVLYHVLGDLKHREIAAILNKPLGTVTWTYQQALQKLRSQFKE